MNTPGDGSRDALRIVEQRPGEWRWALAVYDPFEPAASGTADSRDAAIAAGKEAYVEYRRREESRESIALGAGAS